MQTIITYFHKIKTPQKLPHDTLVPAKSTLVSKQLIIRMYHHYHILRGRNIVMSLNMCTDQFKFLCMHKSKIEVSIYRIAQKFDKEKF